MMTARRRTAIWLAVFGLVPRGAAAADGADDGIVLDVAVVCRADDGREGKLPPGIFLPVATWDRVQHDYRTLAQREARSSAENESLRAHAGDVPWMAVATGTGVGVALGILTAVWLWPREPGQ